MLGNYLKIAIRQLKQQNLYSLVNLAGVTIAMTCVILIFLYARSELSFDLMHPHPDLLYRITSRANVGNSVLNTPTTPPGIATALDERMDFARVRTLNEVKVQVDDQLFWVDRVYFADTAFLEIFNVGLGLSQPAENATEAPGILLTSSLAEKTGTEKPGRLIRLNGKRYEVVGIIENPRMTHFSYQAIIPTTDFDNSWTNFSVYTYIKTSIPTDDISLILEDLYNKNMKEVFQQNNSSLQLGVQKVRSIHLNSHLRGELAVNSNSGTVYSLIMVGFFLLLAAGVNYANMLTARLLGRSREVGIRKAIGSLHYEIVIQLLTESVLLVLFSVFLSLIAVDLLLPYFVGFFPDWQYMFPGFDWQLLAFVLTTAVLMGLAGAFYPALKMSRLNAAVILKGTFQSTYGRMTFRRVLVVIQFSVSIILVLCTWFINRQMNFVYGKDLGYERENLLVIKLPLDQELPFDEVKTKFEALDFIEALGTSQEVPGEAPEKLSTFIIGESGQPFQEYLAKHFSADEGFTRTLGVKVVAGVDFAGDIPNLSQKVLINNNLAILLGGPEAAVGQVVRFPFPINGQSQATIHGVLSDFHFRSLYEEVRPLIITYAPVNPWLLLSMNDVATGNIDILAETWKSILPQHPFGYEFVDQKISSLYTSDYRVASIFGTLAVITTILAGMGLFAFSFYVSELRKKEIGIRKISGAGLSQILLLINKEYLILIFVSALLSWPIAYTIINRWLEDFAYQIELTAGAFLLSFVVGLVVILATVSYNTIRAASADIVSIVNRG